MKPRELEDCHTCHGDGEITVNTSPMQKNCRRDPQEDREVACPDCKGDGTQIRADLELLARAMSLPSERPPRRWKIVVCTVCGEHVNDCTCEVVEPEPPTIALTVRLDDLSDVVKALRDEAAIRGYTEWPLAADFIEFELGAAS